MRIYKAVVAYKWTEDHSAFEVHCESPLDGGTTRISRSGKEAEQLAKGVQDWIEGELLQNALPMLTDDERELMLCGFVLF